MSLINPNPDPVKHPGHYLNDRFGCECIDITRHMTFPAGNAFKYVWRHEDKNLPAMDLNKSLQYLDWARADFHGFGQRSILSPASGKIVQGLMVEHVIPRLDGLAPVYTALVHIAVCDYSITRSLIEEALR